MSMVFELTPKNFMTMSKEEKEAFFEKNGEKVAQAMDRVKHRIRYSGP